MALFPDAPVIFSRHSGASYLNRGKRLRVGGLKWRIRSRFTKAKEETVETLGAKYNISQSLPAARFSNPAPKTTGEMPYDIRGNEPPRRGSGGGFDSSPIPYGEHLDVTDTAAGFSGHPNAAEHKMDFNRGRNSGQGTPEDNPSEGGPGTAAPAAGTGAEIGEEAGALGDVGGLLELAAL